MSEHDMYAHALQNKFSFVNSFYHTEPRLDIMSEDWRNYGKVDFLICTEVFEHVLQPVATGLRNLRHLLKPSGFLVFSVPSSDRPHTLEHFPEMKTFGTCNIDSNWVVVSKSADGKYQVFDDNVHFHGGPGTVLEMRLFAHTDILQLLSSAGFTIKTYDQAVLDIGYYWAAHEERLGAGLNQSFIIEARPDTSKTD